MYQNIFFSLTSRLYCARLAIGCSLGLLIINLYRSLFSSDPDSSDAPPIIVTYAFTALHHTATMASLRFFYGIIDLLLLAGETGVVIYMCTQYALIIKPYFADIDILYALLLWGAFISLLGLIAFRIATAIRSQGRELITPFNIYSDQLQSKGKAPSRFLNLLMGRSIWMVHFVGEQQKLRIFRGSLGLIFLCTVLFWCFAKIIFEPITEMALGPIKEYRTLVTPKDIISSMQEPIWNVLFPVPRDVSGPIIPADRFFRAVNVEPIWNLDWDLPDLPNCTQTSYTSDSYDDVYLHGFTCPGPFLSSGSIWDLPDLLITINFTQLDPDVPASTPSSKQKISHVVIGLTNSTSVLEQVTPFPLIQGVNIAASIIGDIRQVYTKPALAALGIFQTTSLFWEPRIFATYPDPRAKFNQDLSTLRLFFQENWSATHIIQDSRQSSVIAGFASVGGLWTTLSGAFSILFGASLLQILWGQKPLSVFGLAHAFQHEHMKKETLRLYPNIINEHHPGPHRGLLSLMRDHLIGLSFLEDEQDPSPGQATEPADEEYQPLSTFASTQDS